MKKDAIGMLDLFGNYGHYVCNVGKAMDELGISVSKMRKMTGLNHEIVKKYYEDQIVRIDKDVFAKLSYVILVHGIDPKNLIEYIPPKKDDKTKSSDHYFSQN